MEIGSPTEEKKDSKAKDFENSDSSQETVESQAADRFREESDLRSDSSMQTERSSLRPQRTTEAGAVEEVNGKVSSLSFDNSIYADSSLGSAADSSAAKKESEANTTHTDEQGNTSTTNADGTVTYMGADGRGYVRRLTGNGFVEQRFGPNPRDNFDVRREYNSSGGYSDHYTYPDGTRDHRRDVSQDGSVLVTDAAGLRIRLQGGSAEFQQRALDQLLDLPLSHRERLHSMGLSVVLADRVNDVVPGHRPTVSGVYHRPTRQIVVGEFNGRGERTDPEYVMRHEVGHAIDHAFSSPRPGDETLATYSAAFRGALMRDWHNMSETYRQVYSEYFRIAAPHFGPAELFAHLYARLHEPLSSSNQTLFNLFPNVRAFMQRRLDRLQR